MNKYDVLEFLSQRKNGEMPEENEVMVSLANYIRRTTVHIRADETEPETGSRSIMEENEQEKRIAEKWAKEHNLWTPISNIFSLGIPGPSGSESDTYIAKDVFVYKTNNLLHCHDSIICALEKFMLYNLIFPDSAYTFCGFTGFDDRSVYPIVKQQYIKDGVPAMQNEIDCYMSAIGMTKIDKGKFGNDDVLVWDVLPKNVLKDSSGDMFVIDAEILLK